MDRGFASIMFIPYLSHLLRHTSIGFWDHRGLLDIMVVWVRSRGIRICCFCVSFGFIEFLEFFGVRGSDISSGIFLAKSGIYCSPQFFCAYSLSQSCFCYFLLLSFLYVLTVDPPCIFVPYFFVLL